MADHRRSFPRQYARTRRFELGRPRALTVAPDGERVLFLRTVAADDPRTGLWSCHLVTGRERLLVDPRELGDAGSGPTAAEQALRERRREVTEGVTAYATDRACRHAAFTLAGQVWVADVTTGDRERVPTGGQAFDPRLSPGGGRLAFVRDGELWVGAPDAAPTAVLSGADGVRWGVAEFVAAEEMGRQRGHWWGPDGERIAACRVDESGVRRWHLGDPSRPGRAPRTHRYPAAGTPNADVSLAVVGLPDGAPVTVGWDREAFPYLARVRWPDAGPLTLLVQSRDQRRWRVLTADPDAGTTQVAREDQDPFWLDLVPGVPAWCGRDRLVMVAETGGDGDADAAGTRRLTVEGRPVTPEGLQVDGVVEADEQAVWFTATDEPTERHLHRLDVDTGELTALTSHPGVHGGAVGGGTVVVASETLDAASRVAVPVTGVVIDSHAESPAVDPRVELLTLGERELRAALLLPRRGPAADPDVALPVLLDPYGGPHGQRVLARRDAYLVSQWLADQGFAVLVVDGRGTPGRGPAWERAVHRDLAGPVLADQVSALEAVARDRPRLDLDRVGIRGWSFGGYLAALAVLRRPDVFAAGIAGAPVVDWRLYDTHYTERYLGHPDEHPEAYRRSSLVDDQGRLAGAVDPPGDRPAPELLIIHGLADDNVVAAHSLRLSAALLAAGRPHRFLPLSGVTHMTPQEVVAENLLYLQVDFLRGALDPPAAG